MLLLLKRFLESPHLVFSTRLLSASQLQYPLRSRLGSFLLSRQPSVLALLQCVDDFQYPCFSSPFELLSSRHCSPRTSRPAVGIAPSVLVILPCCWVCSFALLPAIGCALLPAVDCALLVCCWLCSSACC